MYIEMGSSYVLLSLFIYPSTSPMGNPTPVASPGQRRGPAVAHRPGPGGGPAAGLQGAGAQLAAGGAQGGAQGPRGWDFFHRDFHRDFNGISMGFRDIVLC